MRSRSTGRRYAPIAALAAILSVLWLSLPVSAAGAAVHTAATDYGKAERVKTLPISKQAWEQTQSVMSLAPERVGELISGDRLEAAGDFEVTICLKPDPRHPGGGQPCVGEMYAYNPNFKAKLVLAPSADAVAADETEAISRTVNLTCHQNQPVRNHHCVVSVPWSGISISDSQSLPCAAGSCYVNMLVTAFHKEADSGERVVLGSSDDNKTIHQGLARLSSVRYRGGTKPSDTWRGGRATKRAPVAPDGGSLERKVIYSAKVGDLRAGDQLVVDALARTTINHLPYNVFQRTEVVFAKTKSSTKAYGKVLDTTARVSASNGFNCTQGASAHSNVCEIRKTGVLSVKENAEGPFYVNIVVGQAAIGASSETARWRGGDESKIPSAGGYVEVRRYQGSSACTTCGTGWIPFSQSSAPSGGKPAVLVSQLELYGITSGAYNCAGRSDGSYVCKWRSEGSFGDSPTYSCESRAAWLKAAERFDLKACKEALGAQLWNELLNLQQPVEPEFTGVCEEQGGGDFRCKWYGDALSGPHAGKGCNGYGTFKAREQRWVIDPCEP